MIFEPPDYSEAELAQLRDRVELQAMMDGDLDLAARVLERREVQRWNSRINRSTPNNYVK